MSTPEEAKWPQSLPLPKEDVALSIGCCASCNYWALLNVREEYKRIMVWKTDPFPMETSSVLRVEEFVWKEAQEKVMGVQSMTVYVLSTSQSQTQLVTLYLSQLNDIYDQLRVFVLNESHFTSVTVPPLPLPTKAAPKTSISLEVPLDRLAIVNAHACQYGLPLLTIFEHNTLLHHYIIDSEGTIVTAGISDTIEQTLHHARQRLHPSLPSKKKRNGHSDDGKRLETCLRQLFHSKQQLFSGTVEEQFVQQTLREKILGLESVVQDYLLQFGSISDDEEHLTVVVSSSNPLLSQLLPNRHNFSWIRRKPTVLPYQLGSIVNKEDNDVAASIACVLRQKDKARKHQQQRDGGRYENQAAQVEQIAPTPVAVTTNLNANANKVLVVDLDSILIGCRAAQEFREPDEYGDMMYRGTVVKAIGATATPQMGYKISYDDGDATEPESWKELHDALLHYVRIGEKEGKCSVEEEGNRQKKSQQAAGLLGEKYLSNILKRKRGK